MAFFFSWWDDKMQQNRGFQRTPNTVLFAPFLSARDENDDFLRSYAPLPHTHTHLTTAPHFFFFFFHSHSLPSSSHFKHMHTHTHAQSIRKKIAHTIGFFCNSRSDILAIKTAKLCDRKTGPDDAPPRHNTYGMMHFFPRADTNTSLFSSHTHARARR